MFCPHCGSPADTKFCPTCGKEVAANSTRSMANAAGFWRRTGATIMDNLIIGVPASLIEIMFLGSGTRTNYLIPSLLPLAMVGLYQVLMLAKPAGQTIGDRALSIKVIDLNTGGPLTTAQSLKRWIAAVVMNLITAIFLVGIIDVLWCLWDKDGQTLHDKFAGTTAVKVN